MAPYLIGNLLHQPVQHQTDDLMQLLHLHIGLHTAAPGPAPGGQYVEVFFDGRTTVTGVQVQGGGTGQKLPINGASAVLGRFCNDSCLEECTKFRHHQLQQLRQGLR